MRDRVRVGCRLDLRRSRLLLENRVVAKALAFAFLTVAADGVGFVALWEDERSAKVRVGVDR
jgi:hypothetical protein